MAKFSTGDRVRYIGDSPLLDHGAHGTVDQDESSCPWVIWDNPKAGTDQRWFADKAELELLTKEHNMSDTTTKLFNQDLDADTAILRDKGLELATGARSTDGTEALLDQLWKDNRAGFAKRLRDLDGVTTATSE